MNTTYTLIKTDSNFILVSDNPIDMRKPLEVNGEEKISWVHPNVPYHIKDDDYPYEILASHNKIEGVPTLTFDEVVAREIGYEDIEAKAEHFSELQEGTYTTQHKITYKHGFKDGYLQAKDDNFVVCRIFGPLVSFS